MNTTTTTMVSQSTETIAVPTGIDLDSKITVKDLAIKYNELLSAFELLAKDVKSAPVTRSRGPSSEKEMNENDARRVMLGDLKDESHKQAAEKLSLSYGQVYSARKGFTFKVIYKEMIESIKATQASM